MSEHSMLWNGTSVGDAGAASYSAPYDFDTELALIFSSLTGAEGVIDHGGVFRDALNKYAPTFSVNQITVDTGLGLSYGNWHYNDAALNIAIPAAASGTRIDRIVLRKDWTTQTVRLTRVAGTIGAGVPAITQSVGSTWDVPLFQVQITIGGAGITPTLYLDERVYLPVHGNQNAEGGTKHAYAQISGTPALYASTPAAVTPGVGGSAGASADISRGDHVHALAAPLLAIKTSDQSFPTTTFSNDNLLSLAVIANTNYLVLGELFIFDNAASGSNIKLAFTMPAAATLVWDAVGPDPLVITTLSSLAVANDFGTDNVARAIEIRGTLFVGANAGTLQLQEAGVNGGVGIQVLRGSHLYALAKS